MCGDDSIILVAAPLSWHAMLYPPFVFRGHPLLQVLQPLEESLRLRSPPRQLFRTPKEPRLRQRNASAEWYAVGTCPYAPPNPLWAPEPGRRGSTLHDYAPCARLRKLRTGALASAPTSMQSPMPLAAPRNHEHDCFIPIPQSRERNLVLLRVGLTKKRSERDPPLLTSCAWPPAYDFLSLALSSCTFYLTGPATYDSLE